MASKSRYVAALDGLRAFAVLAVIAYHFNFEWARGGLLGVTVFFVLSGYLITSLLVIEWRRSRTIDLKAFWLRRIKRLMPAIVFLILCIVVLCGIFNHDLLTKMRGDIPPSLFFYSNWWYIFRDVSYFETLGAPSPLTHFWSLAIEEQFYLIWPIFLLILFKSGVKKKATSRIVLVLTFISIVAMMLIYDPNADPSRVYYGTDTRAFSLLIGALLAFMWPSTQLSGAQEKPLDPNVKLTMDAVGIAAFIALLLMMIFADGFSPFMYYGGILLASLLTAVCIAVLVHPQSMFARAAALPPLVWIGKRSYGIYLWHFPIMLLMNPTTAVEDPSILSIIVQLIVMFACAAFSYRFIENPIRNGAIGAFFTELSSGVISIASYVRAHVIQVSLSIALILGAVGCLIFIPPVYAVDNIEALQTQTAPVEIPPKTEDGEDNRFSILLIGDSVPVRTVPYFDATFPKGAIDAVVNRRLTEGVMVYNYYKDLDVVGDIVVFAIGTNGPANDEQVDELVAAVGPEKSIYLINTRSPDEWVQTTNDAFWRAADRYENVSVIDWYATSDGHGEYFDGDGTHLNEEGAQVYTEMIRVATGLPIPEPVGEDGLTATERMLNGLSDLRTRVVSGLHASTPRIAPESYSMLENEAQ